MGYTSRVRARYPDPGSSSLYNLLFGTRLHNFWVGDESVDGAPKFELKTLARHAWCLTLLL